MRKSLVVSSTVALCLIVSTAPSYANYMVDSPGTGVERLQFPALPTVTPTHSPIVNNIQLHSTVSPTQVPVYAPPPAAHGSYGSPQAIAAQIVNARYPASSSQLGCFDAVINRESGWDVHAYNPSGAYGLPQALPGSRMASEGADWRDNPWTQLRWALKYMISRSDEGSPCGAWNHELNFGWY